MAKLHIVVGNDKYPPLEVPCGCTVGSWKSLVAQGFLGDKVLYAEKLTCHGAEHRTIADATSVPMPPAVLHVTGPRSILGMFAIALKKKVGQPKCLVEPVKTQEVKKSVWPWVGKYRVLRTIGSGFMGPCVYEAQHVEDATKVALKWPVRSEEVRVLKAIAEKAPSGCRGIPELLASGQYDGRPYIVMEVFRMPLQQFFPRIWSKHREQRWPVACILGRLLLRRLEALHSCGFVHCDISPENILLGRGRGDDATYAPYLVDFGLARKYPGGPALAGEHGSCEWSSVRSGDGGERRPEDDLEALGWVLVNCLHSVLPWFGCLEAAYSKWHLESTRESTVRQVQFIKRKFLNGGWQGVGNWCANERELPKELYGFLLACQAEVLPLQRPDYAALAALLGGCEGADVASAEREDLMLWHQEFAPA